MTTTNLPLSIILAYFAAALGIFWWGFHEINAWSIYAGHDPLGFWLSGLILAIVMLVTRRGVLLLALLSFLVRLAVGA